MNYLNDTLSNILQTQTKSNIIEFLDEKRSDDMETVNTSSYQIADAVIDHIIECMSDDDITLANMINIFYSYVDIGLLIRFDNLKDMGLTLEELQDEGVIILKQQDDEVCYLDFRNH